MESLVGGWAYENNFLSEPELILNDDSRIIINGLFSQKQITDFINSNQTLKEKFRKY